LFGEELIQFDLGEDFSVETGLVVCEIYKHNGDWKFNAIGAGYANGLAGFVRDYGLQVG
jgi:tellurium resistance protein TerD